MRWGYTLHVVGVIVLCVGLSMSLPLAFALYYEDGSFWPIVLAMLLTSGAGLAMYLTLRKEKVSAINHREGMAIVALGWLAAGLFGALPFLFAGTFAGYTDCFFEAVSGFTTTGASVMTDIEVVPRGILMWRSLTHWLGGMGIIVLSLAILPFLGVGGMQLYRAEVPGPVVDKLRPRIKDTAMLLWKVYLLFSVLETMLLMFGGMDLFEALCHTFGTMATGGFSTKNASVGHYNSVYIDAVIILFMFIAGINFSLHFQLLRGRPLAMWRDPEFRFYGLVILIFTVLSTISVYGDVYAGFGDAFRYSVFQVVSICTTTGYATADYELWAPLPQSLLLFLMFLGGCAGSTGGGMKCMRVMLLLKHSYRELFRLIHPRAVVQVKLGKKIVHGDVLQSIWGYFILFLGLFVVSGFVLAAMGVDVVTAFAAVIASLGNIGPGLGGVGPTDNYAHMPGLGKWVLALCMLLGRLEVYTVIILFVPEFWRK